MSNLIAETRPYRCTLIITGQVNKSEVQLLTYNNLQLLKKLGASNISAYKKIEYQLAYSIKKTTDVNYIEILFTVSPKALSEFKNQLKLDDRVLRFFLIKED